MIGYLHQSWITRIPRNNIHWKFFQFLFFQVNIQQDKAFMALWLVQSWTSKSVVNMHGNVVSCLSLWPCRDQSRYAPIQWETSLHCNDVFHWLGAYLGWSLTLTLWVLFQVSVEIPKCMLAVKVWTAATMVNSTELTILLSCTKSNDTFILHKK